ncbi:hypothetical protein GQ44DRAFT_602537 [Phaeosphaeriaceae sp. PMI808]|nr:hypothetical protein GQ44DRAFT_602537 [Phaeosphaeriaceae sp. PMI808]
MNAQFYQSASYVPPGGTNVEKKRRQEQWDEYQRQQQASISNVMQDNQPSTRSRKRVDSHQPSVTSPLRISVDASHTDHGRPNTNSADLRSSQDYMDRPRRFSSTDFAYVGGQLTPQLLPSTPQTEIRRLSGNFNAPTDIELERTRENRKSLKGVDKLRSKVKSLVRG